MPEYEITFRLRERPDLPHKSWRMHASDPDTARRQFLDERPEAVICRAPLEIRPHSKNS